MGFIDPMLSYKTLFPKHGFPNFRDHFSETAQPNTPTHSNAAVPKTPLGEERARRKEKQGKL